MRGKSRPRDSPSDRTELTETRELFAYNTWATRVIFDPDVAQGKDLKDLASVRARFYHRGQIVTLLRQLGAKPPSTDLTLYYRNRAV